MKLILDQFVVYPVFTERFDDNVSPKLLCGGERKEKVF